ncbi:alpha/beta fold hydrolase [Falsiroseomonas sp. HC035]|uniref:alpha/beta fold hydrolase n=1 Tax=Falsiroseomonas sp. HC035 TaxID=3390999 RepID=UPI003D31A395
MLGLTAGALALLGAGIERWAAARDRRRIPMPGQHVPIGETLLHASLLGRRRDPAQPVIVMDGGLVRGSLAWTEVVAALGPGWLILVFDRAGHNWSTRATGPRSAEANLADQREMLAGLHLAPPWLLVAQDTAAPIAQMHAARHPSEVAGLVLVDPLSGPLAAELLGSGFARSLRWKVPVARIGLWRLARHLRRRSPRPSEPAEPLWQSAKDLSACRAELASLVRDVAAAEAAPPPRQPCRIVAGATPAAVAQAILEVAEQTALPQPRGHVPHGA